MEAPGRCSHSASRQQHDKEEFEARFTKLKLQAKAKMASLNKQIAELKGSGPAVSAASHAAGIIHHPRLSGNRKHASLSHPPQSPDTSFSGVGSAAEEELQDLKNRLSEGEGRCRELQEQLRTAELLLQEKEAAHAQQVTQWPLNPSWI